MSSSALAATLVKEEVLKDPLPVNTDVLPDESEDQTVNDYMRALSIIDFTYDLVVELEGVPLKPAMRTKLMDLKRSIGDFITGGV